MQGLLGKYRSMVLQLQDEILNGAPVGERPPDISEKVVTALQVSLCLRSWRDISLYWCSVSYFMWSGALDSSGVLLSYPVIPLASHISTVLISTLFVKTNISIFPPLEWLGTGTAWQKLGQGGPPANIWDDGTFEGKVRYVIPYNVRSQSVRGLLC